MITPSEAKKFAKGLSKEAEVVIDRALRQAASDNHWPCTIGRRVVHVGDADPLVVIAKYSAVGWVVSLVDDSRDGDFYQFEKPQ